MEGTHVTVSKIEIAKKRNAFNLESELKNHAWMPYVDALQAEALLTEKPVYTYLLRPSEGKRGFAISFVLKNGHIKHDHFSLINPKYGIWRNGHSRHVGNLEKVIRDMMDCSFEEGQPLS